MQSASLFAQMSSDGQIAVIAVRILLIMAVAGMLSLAALIIMIWAIVSAVKNANLNPTVRLVWILVIVVAGPIGAVVYYLFGANAGSWDKIRSSMVMGARSLWLHKMRTILSMSGIIIATGAVISLMGFGRGTEEKALSLIKGTATNIIVRSVKPADKASDQNRNFFVRYGVTRSDYKRLLLVPTVKLHVPMRIFNQEIRRHNRMVFGRLVATTESYKDVNRFKMAMGRFLQDADDHSAEGDNSRVRNVAVLGATVAHELFPFESPLGKTVIINQQDYVVVGIVDNRMPAGKSSGKNAEDFNNDVYISLDACLLRFGEKIYIRQSGSRSGEIVQLHQITLTVEKMDEVEKTADLVRKIIMSNPDHADKQDVRVSYPLDRLREAKAHARNFTWMLVAIAAISLLVGGIGIMNIMLATVTERTREIGVRRALGAKRRDIVLQFMVEALMQTIVGGAFGVAIGLLIIAVAPTIPFISIAAQLHEWSIPLACVFSVAVGLLFGLYPAYRASQLDPIEALRHE